MPDEPRRSLMDSLRRILARGKQAPSNPQGSAAAGPSKPETAAPSADLRSLSLQILLRHVHVLAVAADDVSELDEAQAEVDRRLVDAQQDADIASLYDAARRLERRRLVIEGRRLGRFPYPWEETRGGDSGCGACMCSLRPPDDESQPLSR
ncbi:hypothetical protein [Frankia sp. CiP3]|uniref:hypothetical protein n=1 Tax=Frankia sp. CiP3 TaxID=2880971 RepID=UPI001EF4BD39|nr:hypothetical protein [Frankia sp. CiP3]